MKFDSALGLVLVLLGVFWVGTVTFEMFINLSLTCFNRRAGKVRDVTCVGLEETFWGEAPLLLGSAERRWSSSLTAVQLLELK